jgi:squalene-hopene/tetraprenyl-beta-curcumene cyclase
MRTAMLGITFVAATFLIGRALGQPAQPSAQDARAVVDKAIGYLKTTQNADGSFSPKIAGPGVSALVAAALLRNGYTAQDPVVAKTLKYLEGQVQKDGGVYSKFLANYTTSVAIMAFAEANQGGKYDSVLKNASDFLKGIQHKGDDSDAAHGGFSYDGKKKPDMSNTGFSIDALIAAGMSKDDPALKNALKFIGRSQNLPGEFNDQDFAKKADADDVGGFVYNPLAGAEDRARTAKGGLRSYGAMTYTGLKSFLYAGVSKDDPRVKAAVTWIRKHYTLDENPGQGKAGLFYYYHTFGKAMTALGEDPFVDAAGKSHPWRAELFEALKSRQQADGSWQNTGDRTFGEENRDLATAFALLSLSYCKAK